MAVLLSYALTTVADVKESLGISSSDSTKDNLIIRKINQATEMIEKYTGRRFKADDYTEYLDATNTDELVLSQRPINSIASISRRDSVDNENSFDAYDSEDYFFTAGSVDSRAGVIEGVFNFTGGRDRIKVVYNAGYTTIPSDIAEAAATLAAFLVGNGTSGTNVKSKTEGQRSITYFDSSQGARNNLFEQLGIDDILDTYANTPVIESA